MPLDLVWHTQLLVRVRPDPELQEWIEARLPLLEEDEFYPIVNPNAPLTSLPEDPGSGVAKLKNHLLASVGKPEALAIRYLDALLQTKADGYLLTHQLAALEWARATGRNLPRRLLAKRAALLDQIAKEQAVDDVVSDLFAERAAFLISFGAFSDAELERFVTAVVGGQVTPGSWAPGTVTLRYDGQTVSLPPNDARVRHCRHLVMIGLAEYLSRHDVSSTDRDDRALKPKTIFLVGVALATLVFTAIGIGWSRRRRA